MRHSDSFYEQILRDEVKKSQHLLSLLVLFGLKSATELMKLDRTIHIDNRSGKATSLHNSLISRRGGV